MIQTIKNASTKIINVNKDQQIIFDGDVIYIKTDSISPPTASVLRQNALNSANSSWYYTNMYTETYDAYGAVFGQWLWSLKQTAQFKYDYSTCECNYSDAYYLFGAVNLWQVTDWQNSYISHPYYDGYEWTRVQSQANFHWGLEVQGAGILLQNVHVWAYVECNKYGEVNRMSQASNV